MPVKDVTLCSTTDERALASCWTPLQWKTFSKSANLWTNFAPSSSSVWIYIWLQVHSKLRLSNFCQFFKHIFILLSHCMRFFKTKQQVFKQGERWEGQNLKYREFVFKKRVQKIRKLSKIPSSQGKYVLPACCRYFRIWFSREVEPLTTYIIEKVQEHQTESGMGASHWRHLSIMLNQKSCTEPLCMNEENTQNHIFDLWGKGAWMYLLHQDNCRSPLLLSDLSVFEISAL